MKNKKSILVLLVLASLTVFSCTNDKGGVDLNGSVKDARIELKLQYPKLNQTRSNDNATVDEDNKVNDLLVFIIKADGNLVTSPKYFTAAEIANGGVVPTIAATTEASYVYVVTNTGPLASGPFAAVNSLLQLHHVALRLNNNPNALSNCVSENVWMAANSGLTTGTPEIDGTAVLQATLQLNYIPAKIYVKVINEMKNYDKSAVILDGVMIVNGGTWTCFTPEQGINYSPKREYMPTGAKFYYNGIDASYFGAYSDKPEYNSADDFETNALYKWTGTTFPMLPANTDPSNGGTAITATMEAEEGFYAFPVISSHDTYLSVYGRYSIDETDPQNPVGNAATLTNPNLYWSYQFGDPTISGATKITQGYKYLVTITLKGDAWTNGGGGSVDPTKPPVPANVKITIQTAEWIPEEINKDIH